MIGQAVGLLRRSRVLLALVAVELFWGFGMVTFESLLPVRLAEVIGDPERAAALLGPANSAAWLASAAGAALTPLLLRWLGAAPGAALLRILQGVTVVGMGLFAGPVGVLVAYLACYAVHGASNPLHSGLLHRQVDGPYRTSVLSLNSMMAQPAGALGGVVLTALAAATSISTAMVVGAVVLAVAAPLYLPAWLAGRRAAPAVEPTAVPVPAADRLRTRAPRPATGPRLRRSGEADRAEREGVGVAEPTVEPRRTDVVRVDAEPDGVVAGQQRPGHPGGQGRAQPSTPLVGGDGQAGEEADVTLAAVRAARHQPVAGPDAVPVHHPWVARAGGAAGERLVDQRGQRRVVRLGEAYHPLLVRLAGGGPCRSSGSPSRRAGSPPAGRPADRIVPGQVQPLPRPQHPVGGQRDTDLQRRPDRTDRAAGRSVLRADHHSTAPSRR